ncbi:MAG: SLBB domain-containing protein [Deltaproteobacteria bacterium]|nr:SLBB domain-containing protein [Deltaproteobacteria bacterium]
MAAENVISAPPGIAVPDDFNPEKLTPDQKAAIQKEMAKTGGQLTPEGVEAVKKDPAFKDLKGQKPVKEVEKNREVKREAKKAVPPKSGSLFDRYLDADSDVSLRPFGYDLFSDVSMSPIQDLPMAQDYIIGPGDEINVLLWGRLSAQYSLTVSRDGTMLFPNIGPLYVAGMTFEEMKKSVTKRARGIVGAEINITMGKLRSIQVFVLGEVKTPGAYTVNAMSTLTNALMASGGPTEIGTLRAVELKRANKTIVKMDFYDLLLNGDKSRDFRLQNGDVIFVPTTGALVGVAGNVKRPAVYEIMEGTDLESVLGLAGGIIPTAYTQRIQVERVDRNEKRILVDVNATDSATIKNFKLRDADLVKVFSIVDKDVNVILLNGNVKRPGRYELKSGMRLKDLIKGESELLAETYYDYGLVKRVSRTLEVMIIPFNLGGLLKGSDADNLVLEPRDSVYIFSKWFFKDKPTVSIEGEVRCADSPDLKARTDKGCVFDLHESLTIKDLVLLAGGNTKDASFDDLELYRTDPVTKNVLLFKYKLGKAMEGDPGNNMKLQDMDRVVVHSVWESLPRYRVTIQGEVHRPGAYPYASNMSVKDLVFAAGNVSESGYLEEAELATSVVEKNEVLLTSYKKINLRKALSGDPEHNLLLKPNDTVYVKKIINWGDQQFVELQGEVVFPGRYIVVKGERLSSLIKRAGGFTEKAYLKGAVFTRESVRELQQKQLDEAIDRFEQQIMRDSSRKMDKALTGEAATQSAASFESKRALLEKMRAAKAKGRITIKMEKLDMFEGTANDISVENGDRLAIPQRPQQVQVIGSVYNQTSFVYGPEWSVSEYLQKAGGLTGNAEFNETYILKIDGTAVSRRQKKGFFGLGGFMSSRIDPGDTIVVPEKVERVAWLRETKDITQILYQIAVTAGVLIAAF